MTLSRDGSLASGFAGQLDAGGAELLTKTKIWWSIGAVLVFFAVVMAAVLWGRFGPVPDGVVVSTLHLPPDTSVHFTSEGEPVFGRSKLSSSECWLVQVRTEGGEIVEVCTTEERWSEMTFGVEFTASGGDRKR
ncbi:hypothetical protein [Rhodococcus sp. IEGM 1379]|uniref:hypothetical protein n=1 Tax=Rhodococcus sp. IEGM 1379 TaxID=3047086 RepID=UPI0024B80DA6|nr:hypothetical protein [Rhodococcus sp. IEGM 1379]MDI9918777.1 hypothetical protein [Rhodococcus sp. IEGM 1379]